MGSVRMLPTERVGRNFVPAEYLPPGKDEYYLRDEQAARPGRSWRHLRADEIETLVKNGNRCDDWDKFLVSDPFQASLVRNSEFFGLVRIGKLERVILEHHDMKVPTGIVDSLVISCDIGDNCALHAVSYLAYYLLGDNVILLNIDEMSTTNHAKFGNGIVKEGESEDVRIWIDLMNEAGGRSVMPFDGMTPADACLWATFRDDAELVARLGDITQRQFDPRRGFYGTVGDQCVIKHSRILKDVRVGPHCYIKGANKLKNLTINSSREEPSQVGEGVELVNGIVGLGCSIFYGCKAVRFVTGNNVKLKYGARLIHSYLGDNSTVSCCELLNNLVFPAHEQHHNNSFLAASLVLGQSNIAAGVTIGSNHNSRANDGEIRAGRGFWPGLCTTLKHSCRFASYVLLVKGNYPAELNIPLPFALVSDDPGGNRLTVMPAYWWLYNMYALARNTWKFQTRDKRRTKTQQVEYDCFAPDTAEEMFHALGLLETWTARAWRRSRGESDLEDDELRAQGRELLMDDGNRLTDLEITAPGLENSRRPTVLLKVREAYHAYRQMLHYYVVRKLLDYLESAPRATLATMNADLSGPRQQAWFNLGGQQVAGDDLERLIGDIKSGRLDTWDAIHAAYARLWDEYPRKKQRHALATLLALYGVDRLTPDLWCSALDQIVETQQYVCDQVYQTRKKDYESPFRRITFRNDAEMTAVLGTAEDNPFVRQVREETVAFRDRVAEVRQRV
jgi:hypothetical protein